jgi:hypothetical protein
VLTYTPAPISFEPLKRVALATVKTVVLETVSLQLFIWPSPNGELKDAPSAEEQRKLSDGHKLASECKSADTMAGAGSDATCHILSIHMNIAAAHNV